MIILNDSEKERVRRERVCTAVEGYLMLDMPGTALEELDSLPDSQCLNPSVLSSRVTVFMHLRQWEEALSLARKGCRLAPGTGGFYLHAAFCLHELGCTEAARKSLETAPRTMRRDPLFHYNLGCYLSVLGRKTAARVSLNRAFRLDGNLRDCALKDPDLRVLWSVL